jgi:hypothetical protein
VVVDVVLVLVVLVVVVVGAAVVVVVVVGARVVVVVVVGGAVVVVVVEFIAPAGEPDLNTFNSPSILSLSSSSSIRRRHLLSISC